MRRNALFLTLMTTMALAPAACSRTESDTRGQANAGVDDRTIPDGEPITVTGCLTGAPDRNAFVVTADRNALISGALHAGSGEVPTYTYELVGGHDLAQHVGRQVEVKGRLGERDDEVDVEASQKTELPKVKSGDDTVIPAIETNQEMEIKVQRIHVSAVTPTGAGCTAGK